VKLLSKKSIIMKNRPVIPYSEEFYPPVPTKGTMFWRKFVPWQLIRFFVLNIKILRIVVGGHS
jgi:hypothetical protein